MKQSTIQLPNTKKIIADIGGTNARFALLNQHGEIQDHIVLEGANFPDFISAFKEYTRLSKNTYISDAAIAIANPISGDVIKMTNHNWEFSINKAKRSLGLDNLLFKNDFEALAMSIPFLKNNDLYQIGGGTLKKKQAIGILGPGTGLGVSSLINVDDKWIPIPCEGGHVSFSPTSSREIEIFETCRKTHKHVSAERLISGPGLIRLYEIICQLDNVKPLADITAHEVSNHAIKQSNTQCEETLEIFMGLLGVVAGNLALTIGAKGGVYIGGGIVPKMIPYFESSTFREKFEAKGRFKEYMSEIPVFVIQAEYPALIGMSQIFSD